MAGENWFQWFYLIVFLLSILMTLLYMYKWHKHFDVHIAMVFVLVPVVNRNISAEQTRQRYAQINDFERMLTENGTVILKFMLHISKDEQRERLQERIDDESKHWKFSLGDLDVRKQWNEYQAAYAALLGATSTPWAPWIVVPADSKTHRNLMIATVVRDTLQSLNLSYPPAKKELRGMKIE